MNLTLSQAAGAGPVLPETLGKAGATLEARMAPSLPQSPWTLAQSRGPMRVWSGCAGARGWAEGLGSRTGGEVREGLGCFARRREGSGGLVTAVSISRTTGQLCADGPGAWLGPVGGVSLRLCSLPEGRSHHTPELSGQRAQQQRLTLASRLSRTPQALCQVLVSAYSSEQPH